MKYLAITMLLLTSCLHVTGSRIDSVMPLASQGEFFVTTTEVRSWWFIHWAPWWETKNVLRCFNEVKELRQETICFSVFDSYDALDMAIQNENDEFETYRLKKR